MTEIEVFTLLGKILLDNREVITGLRETEAAASKAGDGIARGVGDGADKAEKRAGNLFARVGDGLARIGQIGLGVQALGSLMSPVVDAVKNGIAGVLEGQTALAQLDTVIASTGNKAGVSRDQLVAFSEAVQANTRFTFEQATAAQSMLLTFTNIGADGGIFDRATQATLDMATAMGGDASQQAIALGKALNNPIAGVSALGRVGVQFSDDQKKMIESLVETGDLAGAQTIILKELETQFGGSAAAAGAAGEGPMVRLNNALGEVSETVASAVLPYLGKFTDFMIANLPTIERVAVQMAGAIGTALAFLFETVVPFLIRAFNDLQPTIKAAMPVVVSLRDVIVTAFGVVSQVWDGVLKPVLTALAPLFEAVFGAAGAAVKTAITVIQSLLEGVSALLRGDFTGAWNGLKGAVGAAVGGVVEIVTSLLGGMAKALGGFATQAGQLGIAAIVGLGDGIRSKAESAAAKVGEVVTAVVSAAGALAGRLTTGGRDAALALLDAIKGAVGQVAARVSVLAEGIVTEAKRIPARLVQIGADLVAGLANGITGAIGTATAAVKGLGDSVVGGLKGLLGIKSPSTVMAEEVGIPIAQGLAEGISRGVGIVTGAMRALGDKTLDAVAGIVDTVSSVVGSLAKGDFIGAIGTVIGKVIDLFTSGSKAAAEFAKKAQEALELTGSEATSDQQVAYELQLENARRAGRISEEQYQKALTESVQGGIKERARARRQELADRLAEGLISQVAYDEAARSLDQRERAELEKARLDYADVIARDKGKPAPSTPAPTPDPVRFPDQVTPNAVSSPAFTSPAAMITYAVAQAPAWTGPLGTTMTAAADTMLLGAREFRQAVDRFAGSSELETALRRP